MALYVDTESGPYPALLGADRCWGVDRDGKRYDGPHPVVAHPPCKSWGKFAWRVREVSRRAHDCGPRAVAQVRAFGGVLEHPVGSGLWKHCALPKPGAGRDAWGGFTVEVNQCDWGHPARKPTLLYIVGLEGPEALPPMPAPGTPTHCIVRRRNNAHSLPELPKKLRHITPPAFAAFLAAIAKSAAVPTIKVETTI